MKKFRIFTVLLALIMLLQLSPFASAEGSEEDSISDPSVTKGCKTIDAQAPLYGSNKMLETAQAAMLYEVGSNTVMYSWNPDIRMDPASMVKIVTAMVVLENCDIHEELVVTETALASIPKKQHTCGLLVGEKFPVDFMLYALLVGSANDAAVVLAEHVAGSQEDFVAMMNEYLMRIGCKDTYVVNCHGIYDERQFTTARDVIRMTTAAITSPQKELFMEYFSTTSYLIAATDQSPIRRVETTNYLITIGTDLYYDRRVTGGRTGITHDSKRSLVVTAESNGLVYVGVVLSATPTWATQKNGVQYFGSYEEMAVMLEMGFGSHSVTQVLYDGQVLSQFPVNNGMNHVALGPVQAAEVILPAEAKMDDLTLRFNIPNGTLEAPIKSGEMISTVEVWYGSVCVAWSPVVTLNGSRYMESTRLEQNRYGGGAKVWVILLILAVVGVVGYLGVKVGMQAYMRYQAVNQYNRHRRRRDERRRMN